MEFNGSIIPRMLGQQGAPVRRVLEDIVGYDPVRLRRYWNETKQRTEVWHLDEHNGVAHWHLLIAYPSRVYRERFIASLDLFAGFLGTLMANLIWGVNANPVPNATNFADTNEIGGGVEMLTDGNTPGTGDWCCINFSGGQYITTTAQSPHVHFVTGLATATTNVRVLTGLVSATNKPTSGVAFPALLTFPNDGFYLNFNTADMPTARADVVVGGALVDQVTAAFVPDLLHHELYFMVNNAGTVLTIVRDAVTVATLDISGLAGIQLQPYTMIMTNTNAVRGMHFHDFELIMDSGGL